MLPFLSPSTLAGGEDRKGCTTLTPKNLGHCVKHLKPECNHVEINCVYQKQFQDVFPSPWNNILYINVQSRLKAEFCARQLANVTDDLNDLILDALAFCCLNTLVHDECGSRSNKWVFMLWW